MNKYLLVAPILLIVLCAPSAFGQREMVFQAELALETHPMEKETATQREKALVWVIETDQVQVGTCGGIVGLFADKKNKSANDMTGGYIIGMAAFKLKNPEKAKDEYAAQLAGLEAALKMYEAIVRDKPKAKNDAVEDLLIKRKNGELAAVVNATDCSRRQ